MTVTIVNDFTDDPEDCQAEGDTAAVKFNGPADRLGNNDVDDPGKLDLLIQDDNGPLRAYRNGFVVYDTADGEYQITSTGDSAGLGDQDDEAPAPMRFRIQEIEIPLAERGAQGQYEAQSVTIMVGGDVYIYTSGAALTAEINDAPDSDKRNELVYNGQRGAYRLLGRAGCWARTATTTSTRSLMTK